MKESAVRLVALAFALLFGWVVAAPCAAQTAGAASALPGAAAPAPQPALLAAPGADGQAGAGELPPSTVSPAIERFMRQSGRGLLAAPAAPALARQARQEIPRSPARLPMPPALRVAQAPGGRGLPPGAPAASAPGTAAPAPSAPGTAAPAPSAPATGQPPGSAPVRVPGGRGLATMGPSPLEIGLNLTQAPLEPTDLRFPINLATAMRLSDARPLIVAAAQASAWVAEAQLARAKVLWVPTAMFGADYIRHDGGGPDFNKGIMTSPSVNYFMAGGSADLYVNFTDAYFEPLVARQVLTSRQWDIQTAKNGALQQTADAYFLVHQYRGMYVGALYTVAEGRELIDRVAHLSRELVPTVEVDRARNMVADLQQRAVSAREAWRVASANLTQVLRLDPRAVVVPQEEDHLQITLIDPARTFDDLMPVALANRPEIASRVALVQAAEARVRREKMRPLLPLLTINGFQHAGMYLQFGIFGLGPNSSLNQFRERDDVAAQLVWQLEGFGLGNLARIKWQRGAQSQAIIDLRDAQDAVAAEVTRALARVQSAAARVLQADRALRTGIITFNGHLEGLEQTRRLGNVLVLTFRPQEAVYSLDMLNVAFNEYFTTIADYNRAQFELFHALGYPAQEIAVARPPGDIGPVNTARPAYLPPVGTGPPPATR